MGIPLGELATKPISSDRGLAVDKRKDVSSMPLCDMIALLQARGLAANSKSYLEIIDGACRTLRIETRGMSLVDKARVCVEASQAKVAWGVQTAA
jgi:hypothetical protein